MAERKAVNKYIPADFDPKKHSSVNKYRNSHPLRERARKLDQGILVIRFELPFNIWCDGCNNHIGMGVRYNAEKSKTGNYYSTAIYKFRMKCHLCDSHFEIETDPANCDYKILNGARRQENRWDPKDNEQIVPDDKGDIQRMATDAMYRLEHQTEDLNKGTALKPTLERLQDLQDRWKDDFSLNQTLRKTMREHRRKVFDQKRKDESLLKKACLSINLVPESPSDLKKAIRIKSEPFESFDDKCEASRLKLINESVFPLTNILPSNPSLKEITQCLVAKRIEESGPSLDRASLGISEKETQSKRSESKKGLVPYSTDSESE